MSDKTILDISNAEFGYMTVMSFMPVVSGVNIRLEKGTFIVLEGPNGCGKSTIIKAVLGTGAHFRGSMILNIPRSVIGYVPQEHSLNINSPVSASDVIRSSFPFGKSDEEKIIHSLEMIGLAHLHKTRFGSLSGGQRRRVLLARAIASNAQLIILDEPTANIDKESEKLIEDILYSFVKKSEAAVLATTHISTWASKAVRVKIGGSREL
jgi:ABC-type Mn2+/Zn2+ transport system ATPase subunit